MGSVAQRPRVFMVLTRSWQRRKTISFRRARVMATYRTRSSSLRFSRFSCSSTARRGSMSYTMPRSGSLRLHPAPSRGWMRMGPSFEARWNCRPRSARITTGYSSPLESCMVVIRTPPPPIPGETELICRSSASRRRRTKRNRPRYPALPRSLAQRTSSSSQREEPFSRASAAAGRPVRAYSSVRSRSAGRSAARRRKSSRSFRTPAHRGSVSPRTTRAS